ncbi:MAG: patatin-like phospholipase family protein [Chloroflexi bacterium]|nr:patatin-like phospholipase family protein [Chloroflexota bacterium]
MQYDLVFEGGGAKGLVFVGAMQAFEAAGHSFRRVIGTSAGAITATLLAAGYDADELLQATSETLPDGRPRFSSFMDTPASFDAETVAESLTWAILESIDNPILPKTIEDRADRKLMEMLLKIPAYRNIFSFVEKGGWYDGHTFLDWLREKLNANGRKLGNTTLAQLNTRHPDTELTVLAADTVGRERLILNHRSAPNLPVVWAVRMSMSIPFLWQEVVWQKRWGRYRAQNITGHTIVDGGVLSNFAIDLLVTDDKSLRQLIGPIDSESKVLGLLIDENLVVPGSGETGLLEVEKANIKPNRLDLKQAQTIRRISQLADTLTNAHDKFVISEYQDRVCRLPARGYGTTEFDMSAERIQAIINAGRSTMKAFLRKDASPRRRSVRSSR